MRPLKLSVVSIQRSASDQLTSGIRGLGARLIAISATPLTRWFPYADEIAWMKGRIEFTLSRYICSGVTSVVALGAIPWEYEVRAKADKLDPAPRVLIAGGVISVGPPSVHDSDPIWDGKRVNYVVSKKDEVAPLLDELTRGRVDLIKAAIDPPELTRYTPLLAELIRQSHARGYRVDVHATSLDTAKAALASGADILAHTVADRDVDAEFLLLAEKRGAINTTTVGSGEARLLDDKFVLDPTEQTCGDPEIASAWQRWTAVPHADRPLKQSKDDYSKFDRQAIANLRKIHAAGIPIAVGSDAGTIGSQHGPAFQQELRLMAQAGLTPSEIVVAATRNGARALGLDKDLGTISPGKFADLVLLSANPLEDAANLDHIDRVLVKGKLISPRR